MVRIVQVVNGLGGGIGRGLTEVLPRLDRSRFQVEVICLFGAGPFEADLRARGVPVRVLGLQKGVSIRNAWRLWRLLRELRPHIVHAQQPESAWHGLPAAWAAGVPIRVSHLRSHHPHWPLRIRIFDSAIARLATRAVACSEAVRRFYEEDVGYRHVQVILNPVDLRRFEQLPAPPEARRQLQVPEEAKVVVCVASLTKHKGLNYLLEALHRVRTLDRRVLLLLAGTGPEQSNLERQAQALALTTIVRFLGQRSDIPLILAASDVAVLPSLREGLGLALIEAGAAGRPSVASRVGGISEVVEDGATGVLVPPADPGALATALLAMLRSPALRTDMGQRARRRVEERFAVQAIVAEWQALYDSLLRVAPSQVCTSSRAGAD